MPALRIGSRADPASLQLATGLDDTVGSIGVVVHDRLLPNGHTIIDHIVISPSGVLVIKVEAARGRVELRNVGKRRKPDQRLFVNGADRTLLVAEARHCAGAVDMAVQAARRAGVVGASKVPVRQVLCFVNASWDRKAKPLLLDGVYVTWPDDLFATLNVSGTIAVDDIAALEHEICRLLAPARH